jgi:hypothetical protein
VAHVKRSLGPRATNRREQGGSSLLQELERSETSPLEVKGRPQPIRIEASHRGEQIRYLSGRR